MWGKSRLNSGFGQRVHGTQSCGIDGRGPTLTVLGHPGILGAIEGHTGKKNWCSSWRAHWDLSFDTNFSSLDPQLAEIDFPPLLLQKKSCPLVKPKYFFCYELAREKGENITIKILLLPKMVKNHFLKKMLGTTLKWYSKDFKFIKEFNECGFKLK